MPGEYLRRVFKVLKFIIVNISCIKATQRRAQSEFLLNTPGAKFKAETIVIIIYSVNLYQLEFENTIRF